MDILYAAQLETTPTVVKVVPANTEREASPKVESLRKKNTAYHSHLRSSHNHASESFTNSEVKHVFKCR